MAHFFFVKVDYILPRSDVLYLTMAIIAAKREQPLWKVPENGSPPKQLTLYNSLTRKKEIFQPNNGKVVSLHSLFMLSRFTFFSWIMSITSHVRTDNVINSFSRNGLNFVFL